MRRTVMVAAACAAALALGGGLAAWRLAPDAEMTALHPCPRSQGDFDGDGVDDLHDLLQGARADAEAAPAYDDGYYEGGYPPADRGACTDTVWRAFAAAGFDLKAMVDADIARDPGAYAQAAPEPDPNIDFRRVGVLQVFLSRHAEQLACDPADAATWQAGDIVVFGAGRHIGIVSDVRDARGTPFIIHNMGQPFREENYLSYPWAMDPTARFRFDAARAGAGSLIPWTAGRAAS